MKLRQSVHASGDISTTDRPAKTKGLLAKRGWAEGKQKPRQRGVCIAAKSQPACVTLRRKHHMEQEKDDWSGKVLGVERKRASRQK